MLGVTLRIARESRGMSLRTLAARVGVSHVFLHQVERGDRSLPPQRWSTLANALGLTVEQLARAAVADPDARFTLRASLLTSEQRETIVQALMGEASAT